MKVHSSELFYLIKGLSKSERIYFRKYCKAFVPKGSTGYMQLFDFINKMNHYDESMVKQHFESSEIGKHLPAKKNYLQSVIYKALNSYYSTLTYEIQVRNLLNVSDILQYKNLKKQSEYCLQKASKIAGKFQMDTYLIEIEKSGISKAILSRNLKKITQIQSHISYTFHGYIKSLEKSFKARGIMLQIISDFQQSGKLFKHSQRYGEYENILKQTLKETDSPTEKTFCLQVLSLLYQNTGKTHEVVKTREQQLRVFADNPEIKQVFPARYLACLNDISQQYKQLNRYDECLKAVKLSLTEIERLPFGRTKYFQLNYKLHSYQILLDVYQSAGLYSHALLLINTIESVIKKNQSEINSEYRLVLNLQFASINFMAGNYSNCQKYIQAVFNDTSKVRKDVHVSASILNIITQFEQRDYAYMNYLISYYSKKYKSRSPRYSYYTKLVATVGKMLNSIDSLKVQKKRNEVWECLQRFFEKTKSDQNKDHLIQGFDYVAWACSKQKNKPMFQIIQNDNKRLVDVLKGETPFQ